jgi:hypothetical protein
MINVVTAENRGRRIRLVQPAIPATQTMRRADKTLPAATAPQPRGSPHR